MTIELVTRVEQLEQRLRDVPEDARARAELAMIVAQLGDYATAIDHDARAWSLRPDDPTPIQHVIAILVDSGKWLGAMAAIDLVRDSARGETAFVLDLATTQVLRRIAGVFPSRGHHDGDRVIDRLVTGARARSVGIQVAVARALIDLNRIAEASELLEAIDPTSAGVAERAQLWFLRGALCERSSDLARAVACYEAALALEARPEIAINLISVLLESNDTIPRIEAVLERLDVAVRDIPEVRFNEAIYRRRIGDQDGVVMLLSKIASDRTTELGRMARQVLASC